MREFLKTCACAPIRLYRVAVLPLKGPVCRFRPTCSAYALKAIQTHGVLKGFFLALVRIGKCHPFHRLPRRDPVPESFAWREALGYKRGLEDNRKI